MKRSSSGGERQQHSHLLIHIHIHTYAPTPLPIHARTLVVAPQDEKNIWIFDLIYANNKQMSIHTHTPMSTYTHTIKCVYVYVCIQYVPVHARTLVVAPQDEEIVWVFDLICQQQTDGLQGVLPSVHIIAQKEVVAFGAVTADFEELCGFCV